MPVVKATLHSAISIVSAIATGKGAALGISRKVEVIIKTTSGTGIVIEPEHRNISSRLINKVIEKIVPKEKLEKTKINISLKSEIPTGYGLKSSSAISSVISLACSKIYKPNWNDSQILNAGIDASLETGVSLTGAYDDAAACYYGGLVVTDNYKRKLINSEMGPIDLKAVIFIPRSRKRGNIKKLKILSNVFEKSWNFAYNSEYWNAMTLNGFATTTILDSNPKLISELIHAGAVGASLSGNGPSIAAVAHKNKVSKIKKVFSNLEGRIIVSNINNEKAQVHEL